MRFVFAIAVMACFSQVRADEIGGAEEPIVETTVSMPTRFLNDAEKRCDMVRELSDKSHVNYRVLSMKIMDVWQSSIQSDRTFIKNATRGPTIEFTVKKDGSIEIQGTDPPARDKTPSKKKSAKRTSRTESQQLLAGE